MRHCDRRFGARSVSCEHQKTNRGDLAPGLGQCSGVKMTIGASGARRSIHILICNTVRSASHYHRPGHNADPRCSLGCIEGRALPAASHSHTGSMWAQEVGSHWFRGGVLPGHGETELLDDHSANCSSFIPRRSGPQFAWRLSYTVVIALV
ncbi:uncharacterized protein LAESUDRAFT_514926 [Laetiporus sulphureus 93-53]|uniref:Uncharacterized protein n=1 Tax=Laetiporus sulphureus 93-53 TaxID=1314785 RepID=A0A165G027_9APHY|nr:uncharacterized protein LAESUDRAFT_514926 [Laetiporus sulphureus 93-53]KZT09647.1 hypothetical protein LAESUDRAFT_514926 [Laetiporus sulphureus 93-53]